jgi:hypothetical protein
MKAERQESESACKYNTTRKYYTRKKNHDNQPGRQQAE